MTTTTTTREYRQNRFYYKRNNHKVPVPAKTLEEAIEWVNNRNDPPGEKDCILDNAIYDMMTTGSLHLANIVVARFRENRWMTIDHQEEARDRFFKLPVEKRDGFIAKFKPEFHDLFSEERPSRLKINISADEILSDYKPSCANLEDMPIEVADLPAEETPSP